MFVLLLFVFALSVSVNGCGESGCGSCKVNSQSQYQENDETIKKLEVLEHEAKINKLKAIHKRNPPKTQVADDVDTPVDVQVATLVKIADNVQQMCQMKLQPRKVSDIDCSSDYENNIYFTDIEKCMDDFIKDNNLYADEKSASQLYMYNSLKRTFIKSLKNNKRESCGDNVVEW